MTMLITEDTTLTGQQARAFAAKCGVLHWYAVVQAHIDPTAGRVNGHNAHVGLATFELDDGSIREVAGVAKWEDRRVDVSAKPIDGGRCTDFSLPPGVAALLAKWSAPDDHAHAAGFGGALLVTDDAGTTLWATQGTGAVRARALEPFTATGTWWLPRRELMAAAASEATVEPLLIATRRLPCRGYRVGKCEAWGERGKLARRIDGEMSRAEAGEVVPTLQRTDHLVKLADAMRGLPGDSAWTVTGRKLPRGTALLLSTACPMAIDIMLMCSQPE